MPKHSIKKILPYSPKQLYDLVADIENYDQFLPWCEQAQVIEKKSDELIYAKLSIGFKSVKGEYVSKVKFDEDEKKISVELAEGPFKHLRQVWHFFQLESGTKVEFDIDFKLHSKILERVMNMVFEPACKKMINAFEQRAKKLYG